MVFASRPTQKIFDDLSRLPQIWSNQSSRCLNPKGWSKICDPNVQNFCGLIINAKDLILPEKSSISQPFEDFTKKTQKLIYFLFIFVHFILFLTNCYLKFMSHRVWHSIFRRPWKNENFSEDWDITPKAYVHDVGSGDQTTSLSGGIWSLDTHLINPEGTSLSAQTRCLTAI